MTKEAFKYYTEKFMFSYSKILTVLVTLEKKKLEKQKVVLTARGKVKITGFPRKNIVKTYPKNKEFRFKSEENKET